MSIILSVLFVCACLSCGISYRRSSIIALHRIASHGNLNHTQPRAVAVAAAVAAAAAAAAVAAVVAVVAVVGVVAAVGVVAVVAVAAVVAVVAVVAIVAIVAVVAAAAAVAVAINHDILKLKLIFSPSIDNPVIPTLLYKA
jgi:hypothetical protein